MANIKQYKIEINGIQESVKAVDALNESLASLEKRINALQGKAVSVGSKVESGGGTKSSSKSSLSEEEKLQKQIEQIEEKRAAYGKEIYKDYLAQKDLLKEQVDDQKQLAASERLRANTYSNTIAGMKQELADIKSVMQTVDLGDSDQLNQMVARAKELNDSLKKVEESYGQFGRNVGNYASAAEGFKGVKIEVAGTVQEFNNAKEAAKTLGNELKTLQVKKDMGMFLSEEELKRFEELPSVVAQLKSSIQDAGKPMDDLMDAMQSIVAIAQTTKGFSALFGLDGDKIERSIQKLVALQNAMKGLETINKQLQEKQGIGKWISSASSAMDSFAASITKTEKAAKALSLSLKVLSGVAIVAAIVAITKALSDLNKKQKDVEKATEDGVKAYAKAETEISVLQTKLNKFNGTKAQEKKLVDELNSKYGDSLGQYKSLAGWKDALVKKGKVYCQILQKEAEMQAILNLYTENFIKLQKARKAQEEGMQDTVDLILKAIDGEASIKQVLASIRDDLKAPFTDNLNEYNDYLQEEVDRLEKNGKDLMTEANKIQTEINQLSSDNKLFDYSSQIDKNSKKTEDAAKKTQNEITSVELKAMRDGLNKRLMQLEEEKRQTINKLKENGKVTEAEIKKVENAYYAMRVVEIKKYLDEITKTVQDTAKTLNETRFSLDLNTITQQIKDYENEIERLENRSAVIENTLTTQFDYGILTSGLTDENLINAHNFEALRDAQYKSEQDMKEYEDFVLEHYKKIFGEEAKMFEQAEERLERYYDVELKIVREYGYKEEKSLNHSLLQRLENLEYYDEKVISEIINNINETERLNKEHLLKQIEQEKDAERERYDVQMSGLTKQKQLVEDGLRAIENTLKVSGLEGIETVKETNEKEYKLYHELFAKGVEIDAQIQNAKKQHKEKYEQLDKEQQQNLIKIENDSHNKRTSAQQKYFDKTISNYRDFISKINNELQKQPVTDKAGWNIVDIGAAHKSYKELQNAARTTLINIGLEKEKLDKKFKDGLISAESRNATMKQLNDLENETKNSIQSISQNLKNLLSNFQQSINPYIQAVLQGVQDIMSAVADYQDYLNEKEQEQIDKDNEALAEKLEKQEKLISEHKSKVDSIEDELATARGDRRKHLIDQLNAEMAAEREANKQKQKIEQDQKKQQAKQDALDKKRREQEYKRNLMQIMVSTAMATANGLATQPFIPVGIAMGALATTLGLVQYALAKSQKPYAKGGQLDGGVAVGNLHRDGGIKVLGGRAEIEGGEFITNRQTTSKNLDLLEYVNSKKKKIDISDMLEFYNGGKVRSSIKGIRTKFEDGGYIPTLPNNIDIREQLQDVIINQDNRPIYVSVVDINNKQSDVRRVQTLAGLSND